MCNVGIRAGFKFGTKLYVKAVGCIVVDASVLSLYEGAYKDLARDVLHSY